MTGVSVKDHVEKSGWTNTQVRVEKPGSFVCPDHTHPLVATSIVEALDVGCSWARKRLWIRAHRQSMVVASPIYGMDHHLSTPLDPHLSV